MGNKISKVTAKKFSRAGYTSVFARSKDFYRPANETDSAPEVPEPHRQWRQGAPPFAGNPVAEANALTSEETGTLKEAPQHPVKPNPKMEKASKEFYDKVEREFGDQKPNVNDKVGYTTYDETTSVDNIKKRQA